MCKSAFDNSFTGPGLPVKCALDGGMGQKEGKVNSKCESSEEMGCF